MIGFYNKTIKENNLRKKFIKKFKSLCLKFSFPINFNENKTSLINFKIDSIFNSKLKFTLFNSYIFFNSVSAFVCTAFIITKNNE